MSEPDYNKERFSLPSGSAHRGVGDSQPFLFMGIGDLLQRAGRYEQALEAFQRVLEPDSFKARYNLGVTYSNMGRADEAVAIYEQALALAPKDFEAPAARNNLGALLLARGETERALEHFEAALNAAPFNLESRFNAALIYLDRGRTDEGIRLLEEAARLRAQPRAGQPAPGTRLPGGGARTGGLQVAAPRAPTLPANWSATLGLAVLHARAEEPVEAKKLLSDALERGGDEARATAAGFPILKALLDE